MLVIPSAIYKWDHSLEDGAGEFLRIKKKLSRRFSLVASPEKTVEATLPASLNCTVLYRDRL